MPGDDGQMLGTDRAATEGAANGTFDFISEQTLLKQPYTGQH